MVGQVPVGTGDDRVEYLVMVLTDDEALRRPTGRARYVDRDPRRGPSPPSARLWTSSLALTVA